MHNIIDAIFMSNGCHMLLFMTCFKAEPKAVYTHVYHTAHNGSAFLTALIVKRPRYASWLNFVCVFSMKF